MNMMETKTTAPGARASTLSALGVAVRIVLIFDTVALLFAAALHVDGASIPLGSAVFNEPQIVPAAIVEGLAGVIFAVSAYGSLANRAWAWTSAICAHIFAILGFIVGLIATRNGTSSFNFTYHRVMLVIFVIGLIVLLLPVGRSALGHRSPSNQQQV